MAGTTSPEDLNKLKLAELKKLCKDNSIPVSGTRAELIARLLIRQDSEGGSEIQLKPEDEAELLGDNDESGEFSNVGDEESVLLSPGEKRKAAANSSQTSLDDVLASDPPPASKKAKSNTEPTPAETKPQSTGKLFPPIKAPAASVVTATDTVSISSNKVVGQSVSALEEKQRIEARAARFATITAPTTTSTDTATDTPKPTEEAAKESSESAAERLAARAKRFGLTNTGGAGAASPGIWDKKTARAMRSAGEAFSVEARGSVSDVDKLKERANRFGVTTSSVLEKASESEKLAKRAEKFGDANTDSSDTSKSLSKEEEEKKRAARMDRFGAESLAGTGTASALTDAEKAAKRLERFGGTAATKVA